MKSLFNTKFFSILGIWNMDQDITVTHKCNECELTFATRGSMKRHLIDAHETDYIRCEICLEGFADSQLEKHVLEEHKKILEKTRKSLKFHAKSEKI